MTQKTSIENSLKNTINLVIDGKMIKKIVFSMPYDKSVKKSEATLFLHRDEVMLCIQCYNADNKAIRKNYSLEEGKALIYKMATEEYQRTNILTENGDCSVMISSKGKMTVVNKIKSGESGFSTNIPLPSHNKEKRHILQNDASIPFLKALGICDDNGRVFDRKMSKYRQINKFLEIAEDVYPSLKKDGELIVCDLCCGKSYLTFAVYHYLTAIKGRNVTMYGVDLKKDVIDFCNATAESLGYTGMHFIHGDIGKFQLDKKVDMVVSLHACDIATDIVMINAVRLGAKVILSTPCCHHELNRQISCPELDFISRHSILKQKLADAATDSLRALMLEACGYEVTVFELIDPEETPKNVIIRGIYKNTRTEVRTDALKKYEDACRFLQVKPFISNLVPKLND